MTDTDTLETNVPHGDESREARPLAPPAMDPPEDIGAAVVEACASQAWQDIARVRIEQITRYGHTPEQDERHPMFELARVAWDKLGRAKEDLSLGGWEYLGAARRRLVIAAAMIIAQIDRIDRKLASREDKGGL